MKTILLSALCLFLLIACSDSENGKVPGKEYDPPQLAETPDIIVEIPSAEQLAEMENLISEEIDYRGEIVTAYPLYQFVDVNYPQLYVYEIMSNDEDGNWSPRIRGLEDLTWPVIEAGYLIPSESHRTFFPDGDIPGTYNVRDSGYLNLYRVINLISEGKITGFQTGALEAENISYIWDGESYTDVIAIPVKLLISDYVTVHKDRFAYLFTSATNPEQTLYSLQQLERGFMVDEQILFLNSDGEVTGIEEYVISIRLIPDARF